MTAPILSHEDVNDAYSRWAPFYDAVFAWVMRPGRVATAALLNQTGGRVLDVGVGTGLELPMFGPNVKVTGIDLCEPMLDIARKRVDTHKLGNVEALLVMDAMDLKFPDASFDAVIGPYVLTVVPEPERTLDESGRLVRKLAGQAQRLPGLASAIPLVHRDRLAGATARHGVHRTSAPRQYRALHPHPHEAESGTCILKLYSRGMIR